VVVVLLYSSGATITLHPSFVLSPSGVPEKVCVTKKGVNQE
jgi:hypothetical protein